MGESRNLQCLKEFDRVISVSSHMELMDESETCLIFVETKNKEANGGQSSRELIEEAYSVPPRTRSSRCCNVTNSILFPPIRSLE